MTADVAPSAVLDALPKPIAVLTEALAPVYANAAFAQAFDLRSDRLRTAIVGGVRRLSRSGAPVTFRCNLDGGEDSIFDIRLSRHRDSTVLLVADPVSDIVRAEEIYARTRSYFYGVLHNLNLGLIVLDGNFRVTFANQDQRRVLASLGLTPDPLDLIGQPVAEAYPIIGADKWEAAFRAVMEARQPVSHRKLFVGAGDKAAVYALTVLPLVDVPPDLAGAVSITEDVTRLVRLEDDLVKTERQAMVGQMAIALNHEINNPLAAILGGAEIALCAKGLDSGTTKSMQLIVDMAQRIAGVTQRLRQIEENQLIEYGGRSGPLMLDLSQRPSSSPGAGPRM